MPINLQAIKGLSKDKSKELSAYLGRMFQAAVTSRANQIDGNYRRWVDNYAGKPLERIRTTPYYKASNFVPQLIRMHTDILAARQIGLLFGTRPFWRPKCFSSQFDHHVLDCVGEWMGNLCDTEINFYDATDLTMYLTVKCGVQIQKYIWSETSDFRATDGGEIKENKLESLEVDVVPFDDFFPVPITAVNLDQCTIKFHRLRFTKEEVQYRINIGRWDKRAGELLLKTAGGRQPDGSARDSDANIAGVSLTTDVVRPYTAVEAWLKYELEPGKMHAIVVIFNPYSQTEDGVLRSFYNYLPQGLDDPFVDFRIMPREGLFQGYSVPEILEQSQEEQAQIHNARRDANTIALVPGWKKKRLADVGNPSTEWYPGKVFEVDNMEDLEPLTFNGSYNSLVEEEQALMALAERYTGISPAQQGFGTGPVGKKGIYASQATIALLSEGNKRLDIYLKRMRRPFNKAGRLIFTSYRDFGQNPQVLEALGENGQLLQKAFAQFEPAGWKGVFFGLGASDASANKEVDRQNLLLMSQTMSAYYHEIMAIAPQVASMPDGSPAKELALQVLDGARDLANRILFVFDVYDRKKLIPDVRQLLGAGGAGNRPKALDQAGVPQPEGDVSRDQLQSLPDTIAQIARGAGSANGGGQVPGGSLPI